MAFEVFRLVGRIEMEGQEDVTEGLDETEQSAETTRNRLNDLGEGFTDVGKKMSTWVTGPIVAVTGGLFALTKATGNHADAILDLHAVTGMSTDSIQEWRYVATLAGTTEDAVANSTRILHRQMDAILDPTSRVGEAFGHLNIDLEEFENMNADERMEAIIYALSDLDDGLRQQVGMELFKGQWNDIGPIVDMAADDIRGAREEAHEFGGVLSGDALNAANDFRVEIDSLVYQFQSWLRELAIEFLPVFQEQIIPLFQDTIIPLFQNLGERILDLITWFTDLDPTIQTIIIGGIGLLAVLGPMFLLLGQLFFAFNNIRTGLQALGTTMNLVRLGPAALWIVAILAIIGIAWALYENWDEVKEFVLRIWNNLRDRIQHITDRIREFIANLRDRVAEIWNNMSNKIQDFVDGVRNKFENLRDRVKEIWNSIIDSIKGAINTVIRSVNRMIDRFNNIGFNIPAIRVAGFTIFEGTRISFPDIPNIPELAYGGIIDSPTLAMIGENPRTTPEIVSPENLLRQIVREESGQGGRIEIPLVVNGREIARAVVDDMDRELERNRRTSYRGRGIQV